MASFRSGFKILCEVTKRKGHGLRSYSAENSAGYRWESSSHGVREATSAEWVEAKRPARSSSWLSLWKKDELPAPEEHDAKAKVVAEEIHMPDTSLVCTIPVTPLGARCQLRDSTGGAVEKMFEMQEKHIHPKQAQQSNSSLGENSKKLATAEFKAIDSEDFSHEPCEFPLTPKQISFIKRLQHTSYCPMDDLKTVEPPKQMYTRYKTVNLDECSDTSSAPILHPVGIYNSLKKLFNTNTICLTDSQINLSQTARRFYSKSVMDPPQNNSGAMECKKKKKEDKSKSHCVKVPSGIEGASASTRDCTKYKMPGCRTPTSTSCKPKPVKRAPCVKLEPPMPSYSECVKDPTPPARPTECPKHDRGPPLECLEEKLGISIDGCNPPKPEEPACLTKERKQGPKSKSKSCTDNKTECDDVKPYKEAGAGFSSPAMNFPSRFTGASVIEPINVQQQSIVPIRNFSNYKIDPPYNNNGAMECKKKKKEDKSKSHCVKVPSGIEGGGASTRECTKFKMPGCRIPASTDCKPKPVKRAPCVKLEPPMPSYSECVKDPTPPARPTECPKHDRGPPLECLEEKIGISIDGCNPPKPEEPACLTKERKQGPKSKSKSCTDNKTECDDVKPYKEAGAGLFKLPKKCPSASTLTGVSEPTIVMKQLLLPKRSYSYCKLDPPTKKWNFFECSSKKNNKCTKEEEAVKHCFTADKVKKQTQKKADNISPVSCTMKLEKKNKCDEATALRPWKLCEKPPSLFTHKCPQPPKRLDVIVKATHTPPCETAMPTFKVCPKPAKPRKQLYKCPGHEVKAASAPPQPPTPKRCLCDDDPHDLPPDLTMSCKKVKHAKMPRKCQTTEKDCSLKGKNKPECSKCHRDNM